MKTSKTILLVLLLAACAAVAYAVVDTVVVVTEPPQGFPPVLWGILGFILPWAYDFLFNKLPGWLRFVVTWGISFLITAVVFFVFLHYTVPQFLAAIVAVITVTQAVYTLWAKKQLAARRACPVK